MGEDQEVQVDDVAQLGWEIEEAGLVGGIDGAHCVSCYICVGYWGPKDVVGLSLNSVWCVAYSTLGHLRLSDVAHEEGGSVLGKVES